MFSFVLIFVYKGLVPTKVNEWILTSSEMFLKGNTGDEGSQVNLLILTLNIYVYFIPRDINGCGEPRKRGKVITHLKHNKADIVFIQKTHFEGEEAAI